MENIKFDINIPFTLFFEAVDSKKGKIKGSELVIDYDESVTFITHAAYDFFDTSFLIYNNKSLQNDPVEFEGLEWDDLRYIGTDYNQNIINHYEKSPVSHKIQQWLKVHKAFRWVIWGESEKIEEVRQIFLSDYIEDLPDVIKNWKD